MAKKEEKKKEHAVWQYLVDHSKVLKNGNLSIAFQISDEKEFFKRVKARERGDFKRKDVSKVINQAMVEKKIHKKLNQQNKFFQNSKNPCDRMVMWCARKINRYKNWRWNKVK